MTGKKLRPKYYVTRFGDDSTVIGKRMQATDPDDVDSPFVLMPRKDPAAFTALMAYAQMCEPDLAAEIRVWLGTIVKAPAVYGTQGARNRIHIRTNLMDSYA